ncbi:MAG: hypothetical protein ACRDZ2_10515 [Ilumatobacteraceae bacterium]
MADDEMTEGSGEDSALEPTGDDGAEVDEDAEPDADELDEDLLEVADETDDEEVADDEEEEEDVDESAEATTTRTKRRAGEEEEDEDEELLSPDDVEADLDRILKDRLVTADEEEDEDEEEPEDRSEGGDRLQPKRADEQLCPNCFLLVRSTAPGCPVGDDSCPIFG